MNSDNTYRQPTGSRPAESRRRVSLVFCHGEEVTGAALREGQELVVGRAEPSDVVIHDRSLSRQHARLSWRDGRMQLRDLDSTNGSVVNGEQVTTADVQPGDEILVGEVRVAVLAGGQARRAPEVDASDEVFSAAVQQELTRARTFARTFALLALRGKSRDGEWMDALRAKLRPVDRVARYSSDTWLVLCAEADETRARAVFEAACLAGAYHLTAGVAVFPQAGGSEDALVAQAVSALRHASEEQHLVIAEPAAEQEPTREPVVQSPRMRQLYDLIQRLARTRMPVLIVGETGSGKELVARAVHDASPRAEQSFKVVNCATIPPNLIESTLFGHERGAFTGANKRHAGLFEEADGGTVLLDEVGELSEQAQAALLRVLETRRFARVGSSHEIKVNMRVVAATHRDLESMVQQGGFREDLLYRLNALTLDVPPLRERPEEVLSLAESFLDQARGEFDCSARAFSPEAADALRNFHWPGNVRQLRNVVERAAAVCTGDTIGIEELPPQLLRAPVMDTRDTSAENGAGLAERVRRFEIDMIRDALARTGGNQTKAAELLDLPRRTLTNKIQQYGLATRNG